MLSREGEVNEGQLLENRQLRIAFDQGGQQFMLLLGEWIGHGDTAPGKSFVPSILAGLDGHAQCHKGALQLSGRKKPLRHLIGISEELAGGNATPGRTLLASSNPEFVWASLAQIYGLPGTPEWAEWFHSQLTKRKSMTPLLGVGCAPISVRGDKAQFLKWLSAGLRSRQIAFPETHGPILWPGKDLAHIFQPATALTA